jgi:phage I-like protein
MTKLAYVNRRLLGQQRDKLYREALRMELAAAGEDLKKLREIARVHIEKAAAGDMQAIKELADRLDGKPTQILEHSDGESRPRRKLTYEIVHVTKTQEQIEEEIEGKDDLVVDYHEIKGVNGNGRVNGNGHEQ